MTMLRIRPDRWIVCSRPILDALRQAWLPSVAATSFFALRLQCELVRFCLPERLAETIRGLVADGCGRLHLIVDRASGTALPQPLEQLPAHLRIQDWRASPLDVVESIATPDYDLLAAWRRARHRPQDFELAAASHAQWTIHRYSLALEEWEQLARAHHPELMAELYDPAPTLLEWIKQPKEAESGSEFEVLAGLVEPSSEMEPSGTWYENEHGPKETPPAIHRTWQLEDGSGTVGVTLLKEQSAEVSISLECPSRLASVLGTIEFCLNNDVDLLLASGAGSIDWKEVGGKAFGVTTIAVDEETRSLLMAGQQAVFRIRMTA
jgi:hypothetical protein